MTFSAKHLYVANVTTFDVMKRRGGGGGHDLLIYHTHARTRRTLQVNNRSVYDGTIWLRHNVANAYKMAHAMTTNL